MSLPNDDSELTAPPTDGMRTPRPTQSTEIAIGRARVRHAFSLLLVLAIISATLLLFGTESGRRLLDRSRLPAIGAEAGRWVHEHPIIAPAAFAAVYLTCAVLTLPVWWLQVLAGYAFGLLAGSALSLVCHTGGAVVTLRLSRWLGADWARSRAGKGAGRLAHLSRAMGHHGLLVVLAARALHFVPYGLCNYAFGLIQLRTRDAALGTLIGGLPTVTTWVAIGAAPGLVKNAWFWWMVVGLNLVLLIPLTIRFFVTRRRPTASVH